MTYTAASEADLWRDERSDYDTRCANAEPARQCAWCDADISGPGEAMPLMYARLPGVAANWECAAIYHCYKRQVVMDIALGLKPDRGGFNAVAEIEAPVWFASGTGEPGDQQRDLGGGYWAQIGPDSWGWSVEILLGNIGDREEIALAALLDSEYAAKRAVDRWWRHRLGAQ